MKAVSIGVAGVALVLIAITLAPAAAGDRAAFALGALVCSAVALVTTITGWRERPASAALTSAVAVPPPAAPPPRAAQPLPQPTSAEADVIAFLATLQDKGRLVDFLQDDITRYNDAQVGAAARVVHAGCRAVLDEYLRIVPVRDESEGASVIVPAGFVPDEYRLVGKISGKAPFSGTLMHRGWKATSVKLPRVLRGGDARYPTLAPAEVELR